MDARTKAIIEEQRNVQVKPDLIDKETYAWIIHDRKIDLCVQCSRHCGKKPERTSCNTHGVIDERITEAQLRERWS